MDHSRRRAAVWDALILAALALAVVAEVWARWGELAIGVVSAGVALLAARRWPVWSLLVGAAISLVQLADLSGFRVWPVLVSAVACFLAGRRMAGGLAALPLFSAVALVGLLTAALIGDVWGWVSVVTPLVFAGVLPWLLGRYGRLRAELVQTGWQRAEQLERERRLVEREARLRERTRIAHDMHDSLGHELSLIAMRAGALELDRELDDRHQVAAGELRTAAAAATDSLRQIIGVLRDETDPVPIGPVQESIAHLVERSRASGMDIDFVSDGTVGAIPPMVDRAAYRIVQEALTNAAKHAPGATVAVRLEYDEAGMVITVTNGRPRGADPVAVSSGGRGLLGLRERVRLIGGSLQAAQRDGGFEVVARLPAAAVPVTADSEVEESSSAKRFAQARRATHRGLVTAVVALVTFTTAVLLILLGLRMYEVSHSWLDPAVYDSLSIGQQRAQIAGRLPAQQVDGRPDVPEPPIAAGAQCEYYRVTKELFAGPIDVYRLCFAGGQLVDKDLVAGKVR